MRRVLVAGAATLSLGLGAALTSALAVDVTFSGTITGICTLAVPTPGLLGIDSQGRLSSEAGLFATLTVLSIGTNTIDVDPPVWAGGGTPVGYDPTGEAFEVAYTGLGGLSAVDQDFTSAPTSFGINTLPLTIVQVNARASNTNGFEAGDYAMRVVVTCS